MFWMKRLFMQQFMYVHVLEICLNVQNSVWLKKSRTLEDCDIQKIYKCLIYISQLCRTRHDCWTDWGNLITHHLTYQGIRWSWVTDYFSYLARVDAGFLASYKPENLAYSIPVITQVWRRQRGRFSDPPFGFELNQSQQIHLNST